MKYAPIGRSGAHASLLALGAMTFGERNVWKLGGLKQDIVEKMVSRAVDAGINLFDTADVYDEGESEKSLGSALKPYRDQVLIATKVRGRTGSGVNEIGLSRHHIEIAMRKSLERLGTSWVDIYQFHSWDSHVPLDESLETMQDLVEKVKQVGEEQGATPAQIALSWLLSKNHIVLLGARTLEQFEENLGALDVNLTNGQLENLDMITKPRVQYPNWMIERQSSGRTFPIVEP